jgi:hypothetical protein
MVLKKMALVERLEQLRREEAETLVQKEKEIQESGNILRQTMLHKIKQKRVELFSLQKVDYDEDVELVMQQNRHYEAQLEYQTKHLEHIILKNEKFRMMHQTYTNDLSIHRTIQEELVKRIYYAKQIIGEFENKNKDLQDEINGSRKKLHQTNKKIAELTFTNSKIPEGLAEQIDQAKDHIQRKKSTLNMHVTQNKLLIDNFILFSNTLQFIEELFGRERERMLEGIKGDKLHALKTMKRSFGTGATATANYNQFVKQMCSN